MPDKTWKAFERATAKKLSLWLSGGKSSKVLCRQALYGRMIERKYGDLAIHPDCPVLFTDRARAFMARYFVDCKRRKAFDDLAKMMSGRGAAWKWWEKALAQARAVGKIPVLIVQYRRAPWLIMLRMQAPEPLDGYGWLEVYKPRCPEGLYMTRLDSLLMHPSGALF